MVGLQALLHAELCRLLFCGAGGQQATAVCKARGKSGKDTLWKGLNPHLLAVCIPHSGLLEVWSDLWIFRSWVFVCPKDLLNMHHEAQEHLLLF